MHRNRSISDRRRDRLVTSSARSRSRSGGHDDIYVYRRRRSVDQERSYTPPLAVATTSRQYSQQEGSESIYSLSQALLKGIEGIANRTNNSGVINNKIIDEFNPVNNDIVEWINAVDEYAFINNWNDQVTCHLALSKLRGSAETWYRGLPTRIFAWVEWKDLLRSQFISKRNLHTDMTNMLKCVPQLNQGLFEYCFEKLALINKMKLPISDDDKVNLIMGGIKDPQIKFSVETSEISDPAKLARFLKTFDEKPEISEIANPSIPVSGNNNFQNNRHRNYPKQTSTQALISCYYCKQRGHLKRQCPNREQPSKALVTYHNSL